MAQPPCPIDLQGRRQPRISRVVAVVLVVASQLGAAFVLMTGFFTGLCALFSEECSRGENAIITIAMITTVALGFGGPSRWRGCVGVRYGRSHHSL